MPIMLFALRARGIKLEYEIYSFRSTLKNGAMSYLYIFKTDRPTFGYFLLDLHPASGDRFRILSHLTKREGKPHVHTFDENIYRRSIEL